MTARARTHRVLAVLAALYFAGAAVLTALVRSGDLGLGGFEASADQIAAGELLRLLSSSAVVAGSLPGLQLVLGALSAALLIQREGGRLWWAVALAGSVVSALVAYALIALATALGSASADRASSESDYGVSTVLAATLGALLASGVRRRQGGIVAMSLLGLVGLLPVSLGWLDLEHLVAYAVGALVVTTGPTRPRGLLPHRSRALS